MTATANHLSIGLKKAGAFSALSMCAHSASALEWDMRAGVTDMSQRIQALHHLSLGICIVISIIVFGAIFYTLFAHHRSRRPEPAKFHESLLVEVMWTLVPILILIGMAIPATSTLIDIEDNSDADLTVLITASQWKWHYQYVEADFGFYSNLTTPQAQIDNLEPKTENYLLEVDNALVLPTHKKVRFLTTSKDVIHSWWVPDFAVKQDAIPGYINEAWTRVNQPGVHRGQCVELCGKAHPELYELLSLEGRLVLGVFPEVAQLDSLLDPCRKENVELVNELLDLFPDLLPNLVEHMARSWRTFVTREARNGRSDRRFLLPHPPGRSGLVG